jgi:hypothetical protein
MIRFELDTTQQAHASTINGIDGCGGFDVGCWGNLKCATGGRY